MEKILFLDMDGAGANSWSDMTKFWNKMKKAGLSSKEIKKEYDKQYGDGLEAIFPAKAHLVSKIIAQTGAKIVWSTSWRLFEPYESDIDSARRMLDSRGMPGDSLIGYTPDLGDLAFRSQEIMAYLDQFFPELDSCRCAVLDDMEDAGYGLPENCRFFQTDGNVGLNYSIANKIIRYLNAADKKRGENNISHQ
jgi:hypothetical protein